MRNEMVVIMTILLTLSGLTRAFECYIGDADVLRSKTCPNFSDICFKKVPGRHDLKGETQRGCFNTDIATMITGSSEIGCHEIPDTIGTGQICLCDTELCNSSHSLDFNKAYLGLSFIMLFASLGLF